MTAPMTLVEALRYHAELMRSPELAPDVRVILTDAAAVMTDAAAALSSVGTMDTLRKALGNTAACLGDALACFNKVVGQDVFKNAAPQVSEASPGAGEGRDVGPLPAVAAPRPEGGTIKENHMSDGRINQNASPQANSDEFVAGGGASSSPAGDAPCPDGDACPDARRYGAIHPAPPSEAGLATQRTDAALLDAKLKHSFPNASFVHADFARQLERELAKANSMEGRSCQHDGCPNLAQLCDGHAASSASGAIHPDNIEVMIASLLSVVQYDMREAAEKDLRALVEMARSSDVRAEAANVVLGLRDTTVMSKFATAEECRAARDALWKAAEALRAWSAIGTHKE